jgi:cell division GTPase FtsZ
MRVALVGVGQAGGKVVDAIVRYDRETRGTAVAAAYAVNSAKADLLGLDEIPLDDRILIGQSLVKGHGAGADNELGVRIAEEDSTEVLDAIGDTSTSEIDAFLVVAALGGGTGSGAGPVIARELGRLYTEPVYGLGVLPARDEGGIYTLNAARSFRTFLHQVDNFVVFDNDAWRHGGESVSGGFATLNEELARRIGVLLNAGEVTDGVVPESVVDSSEIINTLASGGVSTIGYASAELPPRKTGLFGRRKPRGSEDAVAPITRITSTVRRAALGRLTLPADLAGVERALLVVSGPPGVLSRKGIEDGRRWLEEATGTSEVRGGDYPVPDSDYVAALVLLSGVRDAPRIRELNARAVEAQQNMRDIESRADDFDDLTWSGDSDLDPLF